MAKWRDIFNGVALYNEAQARRLCDKICKAYPGQPRLKTIAAVGAYDAEIGGKTADSKRLTGVMTYLLQSGCLIDPDFDIDVVNFRQKRDFLNEDKQADLVFISFILARHVRGSRLYDETRMNDLVEEADWRSYYGLTLSPQHQAEAWQRRIESCAAKMVVTYGGSDEIGTQTLCVDGNRDALLPVIPTPPLRVRGFIGDKKSWDSGFGEGADLKLLYNNTANDLPMPWLGFAAAADYLKVAASGLSPATSLGRHARALRVV